MRRQVRTMLVPALLLAVPLQLVVGPDVRAQQVVPTPTGTLPPGPIASPTLPPGPVTSPTLPPGPMFHPSTMIFTAVDGHWRKVNTLTLHSRARFLVCFNRSGLTRPGARLRIQHSRNLPSYPTLYRKSMAHVRTRSDRVCFASVFRLNKGAVRGKDVATFIVFNGHAPVIAFDRPFRVQKARRRS